MKKTIPERTLDNGYDVVVVAQAVAKLLRETKPYFPADYVRGSKRSG